MKLATHWTIESGKFDEWLAFWESMKAERSKFIEGLQRNCKCKSKRVPTYVLVSAQRASFSLSIYMHSTIPSCENMSDSSLSL